MAILYNFTLIENEKKKGKIKFKSFISFLNFLYMFAMHYRPVRWISRAVTLLKNNHFLTFFVCDVDCYHLHTFYHLG